MGRVRRGLGRPPETGFIVTWDVDSTDRVTSHQVQYFMFGTEVLTKGHLYRYLGFVEREGVRYLGQSVIFVPPRMLREIEAFLARHGVAHEATRATLG